MGSSSSVRRMITAIKMTALATMTAGTLFASVCSAADVRHNLAAGTQSFIKSYTIDIFEALVPAPTDIIGGNQN